MYPLSKTFFEMHGLIDRRNLISTSINADLILKPKLMMRLSAFSMWRAQTEDGVYRTNGNILRKPSGSEARHIGFQTQAIMGYQFNRNFCWLARPTGCPLENLSAKRRKNRPMNCGY